MLPHIHEKEALRGQHYLSHQEAEGILDYLVLAFQEDQNHFLDTFIVSENISGSQKEDFAGQNFVILPCSNLVISETSKCLCNFNSTQEPSLQSVSTTLFRLRAPPASYFVS